MNKTHLNVSTLFSFTLLLLFFTIPLQGQENNTSKEGLVPYLLELEEKYKVKFSYVDEDLKNIKFTKLEDGSLSDAIEHIKRSTQLQIEKLSDRYYSIVKNKTISICGYIFDNFKQNTIPGATIQILGSSTSAITDLEGYFNFDEVSRDALVQINYLGFKPLFIEAEKLIRHQSCKILSLALSYQELEEVVVYKFLTDGLTKLSDGSLLINTAKFGILPGQIEPDVLQTIQALPGIKSIDETVSEINIRGGTNDQNLVLWDGIKMYQSGHFFGLISAFNPYLTENISVIKNGTSASYGDGISGLIDMQTKDQIENHFFGGAGFNLISGDVYGQLPIKENLAIQFSGRRSYTDLINTPTYSTFSEKAFQDSDVQANNDFYFYDFTGKVLYDINPYQKVRISLININNNLDYLEINQDGNSVNESNLDQTNFSFGGNLESEWSDYFSTKLSTYYTQYRLTAFSISNFDSQRLFQNNLVKESNVKFSSNLKISSSLNWSNGYQFTETGIENITQLNQPNFVSSIKGVIRAHSIYTEGLYTSSDDKINAQFGARLNFYENVNTFQKIILEPRLNLSYEFTKDLKVELLGEFKSQTTNQIIDLEQNFLGIEKRRWILSDESTLPITRSKQGSIGINYDENQFYVGLEGFYKNVNGINIRTQGFQNQNQFENQIGGYTVKGVEFLINKKNNSYSTWLSYTYNLNNYTFDAITPPNFPNNLDVRHVVTLAGNYTYNNFKAGIGLNYRSGRPFTEPDADNPINSNVVPIEINYQDANSSRLPEYIRADVSANYDFIIGTNVKASVGASILNFTNRKNTLNTFYRINDDNSIETVQRISLGATPNLSFRIWF